MISAVLYGRNDSYGYNLHKRAALSINCISEVLTAPDDELLFVDYNTPDDFPTFPEAIQDTLTDRAKEKVRILRVRPSVHERFKNKSHLIALEPVARNVAVRRSNPANRWILSTNTDMIFVPHEGTSLSRFVKDIPRGFYHLPRFEIPETFWETFDRRDAKGTIDSIREWSQIAHLNEIVTAAPFIRFDGPGDFQLIEREDLFRIHGFNESMLLGWHVDSNIAKRLHLVHGETRDLMNCVFGYHCDHTRQVTPAHRKDSATNDSGLFVDRVTQAECYEQAETWGCPDDEIEEIRLSDTRNRIYLNGIKAVTPDRMSEPTYSAYVPDYYDKVSYDATHVLPFLADIFVNAPPGMRLGWIGGNPEMFRLFAAMWPELNPSGQLLVYEPLGAHLGTELTQNHRLVGPQEIEANAGAFIFDYFPGNAVIADAKKEALLAEVRGAFTELVEKEEERLLADKAPRRFVAVNGIHNAFEQLANACLTTARTPFSSRIRQGFVVKPVKKAKAESTQEYTERMQLGSAGYKVGNAIRAGSVKGLVMYGPYTPIREGSYQIQLEVTMRRMLRPRMKDVVRRLAMLPLFAGTIKVVSGEHVLAERKLQADDLYDGNIQLQFNCSKQQAASLKSALEVKLWTKGRYELEIRNIQIEKLGSPSLMAS